MADHLAQGGYLGGCENASCGSNSNLAAPAEIQESNQGLNIYPNPTTGFVRLDLRLLNNRIGEKTLVIFNSLGQMVYRELLPADHLGSNYRLDLTNFESGVYYLKLEVEEEIVATDKLSLMK